MAENITSFLNMNNLAANEVSTTDKFFILHGTGTGRDKLITVEELRKVINKSAGDFIVNSITFTDGTSTYEMLLDADGSLKSYAGFKHEGGDYTIKLAGESGEGITFTSGTTPAEHAAVRYDTSTLKLSIAADGGVVLGSVAGGVTLVGNTNGFSGDVKTSEILAFSSGGTVAIGRSADTALFNGKASFKNETGFDGMAVFKGQFAQNVQELTYDTNGVISPSFDITNGCVLNLTPTNAVGGGTVDLASILANANVNFGARYTVIVNQAETYLTYIDIGISGKLWKMTGFCGCDFIVTKKTGNAVELSPVGAGQLVSSS